MFPNNPIRVPTTLRLIEAGSVYFRWESRESRKQYSGEAFAEEKVVLSETKLRNILQSSKKINAQHLGCVRLNVFRKKDIQNGHKKYAFIGIMRGN